MIRFLLSTTVLAVGVVSTSFAADLPVFPERKLAEAKIEQGPPQGAQYRVRSGKSGVRFLACNEQRVFAGGNVELHCLTHSPSKGWGKSLRWFPKYQLAGLKGELPVDPVVTAVR